MNREHRLWEKRHEKNLLDSYFFQVLKDSANRTEVKLRLNYPYVTVDTNGFFHAYTFDQNQVVYSDAWRSGKPDLDSIASNQFKIGYYKVYHDTLIIEEIGSWTLYKLPWKFVHNKKVGLISGDTIKLPRGNLEMKDGNRILLPLEIYLPLDDKAYR
jgi:hypothetical protein